MPLEGFELVEYVLMEVRISKNRNVGELLIFIGYSSI
jgi:hypothetical protein